MAQLNLADQPVGPTLYLHGQRKRFHVPEGLELLLDEMTREVLRHNPNHIYSFLADYCDGQLEKRDQARASRDRRHSWEWRTWSTDGSSVLTDEELKTFMTQFNVPFEVAEHLATIIQSVYRGFMARKDYKQLIQNKSRRKESLWDEWLHEGKFFLEGSDILDILIHYGLSLAEANDCATKIQALYRGHLVRKSIVDDNPDLAAQLDKLGISHEEATKHAITIQTFFRGHKARKELKAKAKQLIDDTENEFDADEAAEEERKRLAQAVKMSVKKSITEYNLDHDHHDHGEHKAGAEVSEDDQFEETETEQEWTEGEAEEEEAGVPTTDDNDFLFVEENVAPTTATDTDTAANANSSGGDGEAMTVTDNEKELYEGEAEASAASEYEGEDA